MKAAQKGYAQHVQYLIDNGADKTLKDNRENTALDMVEKELEKMLDKGYSNKEVLKDYRETVALLK